MHTKLSSFTNASFFTLHVKSLEIAAVVLSGYNIPQDSNSIAQRVFHDVRIETPYNDSVLTSQVAITLSRCYYVRN